MVSSLAESAISWEPMGDTSAGLFLPRSVEMGYILANSPMTCTHMNGGGGPGPGLGKKGQEELSSGLQYWARISNLGTRVGGGDRKIPGA